MVVAAVVGLFSGDEHSWRREMQRAEQFVGDRFARVWEDPAGLDPRVVSVSRGSFLVQSKPDCSNRSFAMSTGRTALPT